jgi:hypothetical protein
VLAESSWLIDKLAHQGLHMSNQIVALAQERGEPSAEAAYQAVFAALSESARGGAFLAEYARRNRNADTEVLLAALGRLEAMVASQRPLPADQLRQELRALLETIRSARPRIDATPLPARAVQLAGLLDLLERRIEAMAEATPQAAGEIAIEPSAESARTLAIVPSPDEPELPIPSPAGAQPAALALVNVPQVNLFDSAPPEADVVESAPARPVAAASLPPVDPLAEIMALSEDERIALFT